MQAECVGGLAATYREGCDLLRHAQTEPGVYETWLGV